MFEESEADCPAQSRTQSPLQAPTRVRRPPLPASHRPGSSRPFELITAGWFLRHIQVTVTEKGEREGG